RYTCPAERTLFSPKRARCKEAAMSRVLSLLSLALVLGPTALRAADEPARDIVRRALEAAGLKETHEPMALRCRYKVTERPAVRLVEAMGDAAGTMSRVTLTEKESGKLIVSIVNHAGKCWALDDGKAIDLPAEQASMWLAMQHTERVIWLLPLLQDRRFT